MSAEAAAIAELAARAAGRVVAEGARSAFQVRHKGAVDLVTEIDLRSEALIRAELERMMPGVPVLAEEGGGADGAALRWVVDPLDGTTNFVHGFPSYGVSIALEESGQVLAGCVFDPNFNVAYTAWRGGGAWCEGARLQVSPTDVLGEALLLTGFATDKRERADFYLRFVKHFLEQGQGIRRAGSAAIDLCHIAAGRADGYWEFGLSPWDVAAGALLVEEAGGIVSAMAGGPFRLDGREILAATPAIHAAMRSGLSALLSS